MKTFKNKKYIKRNKKSKKSKFRSKTRGGTMNMSLGLSKTNLFSKQTGNKYYDWKTGKWLNQDCYKVLGFPYCTIPHN